MISGALTVRPSGSGDDRPAADLHRPLRNVQSRESIMLAPARSVRGREKDVLQHFTRRRGATQLHQAQHLVRSESGTSTACPSIRG